jgi:hypothetical protein
MTYTRAEWMEAWSKGYTTATDEESTSWLMEQMEDKAIAINMMKQDYPLNPRIVHGERRFRAGIGTHWGMDDIFLYTGDFVALQKADGQHEVCMVIKDWFPPEVGGSGVAEQKIAIVTPEGKVTPMSPSLEKKLSFVKHYNTLRHEEIVAGSFKVDLHATS